MHKLPRTGNAPLAFDGDLIAESKGRFFEGCEQNRGHNLSLYRTEGGQYVIAIHYWTQWQGEGDHHEALVVDRDSVAEELQVYDPCAHVQGFPPIEAYAKRQANLLSWIRRRYEAQVSELLDGIEDLAERI